MKMHSFLGLAAVAMSGLILSLSVPAFGADEGGSHHGQMMQCAKACADCQLQCDSCFDHCRKFLAEGKKEHAKTAQTCADCGECCKLAATLTARSSPFSAPACECCAKCCDECAAACEVFKDDKHMAECAKSCRDCAKACREMLEHLKA
jgi:hypothetical protein